MASRGRRRAFTLDSCRAPRFRSLDRTRLCGGTPAPERGQSCCTRCSVISPPGHAVRDPWRGRDTVAVAASRAASALTRLAGHAGTALPGLVAERIAPGLAARIASDLGSTLLISGSNGKTTTSHLLVHILERADRPVISNRSGANLRQGVASTLSAAARLDGRLRLVDAVGVFEVDELALESVAEAVRISELILLNLFRDQLDRFGETEAIIRTWERVCAGLPGTAVVVSCADDPRVAQLVSLRSGPSVGFGLIEPPGRSPEVWLTPDATNCPRCDASLGYGWTSVGNLGDFRCRTCGFRRCEPDVGVRVMSSRGIDGQTLAFRCPTEPNELTTSIRLPGISNAYNAAAAVAAAVSMGVSAGLAVGALADATPAFGRYELVEMDGRRVVMTLCKNPTSLAELARIASEAGAAAVLFALNDDFADGQDVSWYWDVDIAPLLHGRVFGISGTRAQDFRLRMKYGGGDVGDEIPLGFVTTAEHPPRALEQLIATTPRGDLVVVMATYTALLGLRDTLVTRKLLPAHPR